MSDVVEITREFTEYIIHFVEKPHPNLGNLPVCPFARKARLDNRIRLEVVELTQLGILTLAESFAREGLDLLICIHPRKDQLSCPEVYRLAEELNHTLPGLGLMALAGHPEDPFNIAGLYTRREPYPNIQLLRLNVAEKAVRSLQHSAYYALWSEDNFRNVGLAKPPDGSVS